MTGNVPLKCFKLLSRKDQKKIGAIGLSQSLFGFLDLIGVGLVGILGALSINGIQSKPPGVRIQGVINFLHLQTFGFQTQVGLIALLAASVLIFRTLISYYFNKKTLIFLSTRSSSISARLSKKILSQDIVSLNTKSAQEYVYAVSDGVRAVTLGVLASMVSLFSDLVLLLALTVGLMFVDPLLSISTIVIFSAVGSLLYRVMHVRAEFLGAEYSRLTVEANTKLVEAVVNFREVSVKNQRDYYISWMDSRRYQLAGLTAEMTFMPFVSKYVLEIAVIAGAVVMSGIQFLSHDSARAIASISIFFAAGSRIAPAVLRVQQNGIMMKNSQGTAKQTLEMLENLTEIHPVNQKAGIPDFIHKGFIPHIEVFNVSYRYPGKTNNALENICLSIPSGKMVAIVGPSGSGKTTLVDLVLGVLKPDAGSVLVSSNSPTESINIWGGAIGYVPQEVIIFDGTVRQNVTLGLNSELIRDSEVWDALKTANLEQYFRNLPEGLDTQVGERGTQLSGGQRQRLGIARAVFTKPKLLVMDESTSSLDAETESIIIQSLGQLKGETTIILIAHRLATVRPADLVLYMQEGQILQRGTYSELLQSVSDFKNQARLMGLDGK